MNEEVKQQKKRIYCAIYTRKSTSEGLDQDFTSLDAQRESAENYINSQKHEGWVALQEQYNDGGFTGANLERPALQKLLNDIKDHKIDCVVVYKVDRLSRSLIDFAQVLEFFDKNNVAFVSVTQQFNTNTSMGRLTLNILLSFAQFEREIISERTKDKMGAARKRGQWLGGRPPFGYKMDKDKKKLAIDEKEAEVVKEIFELYLKDNSLLQTANILNEKGCRSRPGIRRDGKPFGNKKYGVTQIQSIIKNVLYIGKVCYAGQIYDGQHEAIIDEETFKKAQEKLKANRIERKATKNTECTGLLSQILHCKTCGSFMFHTYTLKPKGHKYRYYVCSNAQKRGYHSCPTKSINAQAIEDAALDILKQLFADKKKFSDRPNKQEIDALSSPVWDALFPQEKRRVIRALVKAIDYSSGTKRLGIVLHGGNFRLEFDVDLKQIQPKNKWHKEEEIEREPKLRRNLILAHQLQKLFDENKAKNPKQAAEWLNFDQVRLNHLMTMLLIAPVIQTEIISGDDSIISQIPEHKVRSLASEADWEKQTQIWQKIKESISKN